MFRDIRIHTLCIVTLALLAAASPSFGWETEADLLATLNNAEAPFFEKTIACKQLAVVGTEAAVPVLVGLLDDEKLSHYARYGLEPIPSAKVDEAFLAALSTLEGRHLIGMITSIATRGKPEAIGPLAEKLDDADCTVATAAAHGIARLGTPKAAEILGKSMSAEFAPACLVCGKTLADQGHRAEAADLLKKLARAEEAPIHVRVATMLHVVRLQRIDGMEMVGEALMSERKQIFNTGLRAARLMEPADATEMALHAMKDASPDRAALLVTLLGELAEEAGLPAVVEAAEADDPTVRIAALGALASLGGAAHVPLLIDAALDQSEEVSAQAQETLVALSDADVDRAVLGLLGDTDRRPLVIRLIGQRRITAAVPELLDLLGGPNRPRSARPSHLPNSTCWASCWVPIPPSCERPSTRQFTPPATVCPIATPPQPR